MTKEALERLQRLDALFEEVLALPTGERTAFLKQACVGDEDLQQRLEKLLAAHEAAGPFLEDPVAWLNPLLVPGLDAKEEAFVVGARVGPYRIEEQIGRGGMGVVYKARDTRLNRTVALKFLPPSLSSDPQAKDRFTREAQAAASLEHPNLCTIYEIGETEAGQLFIAMPFYAGETLKQKISRGALPVEEALYYACQIAKGLAQAHAGGIVHRDVKPANVLVTREGVVKLVDFGIAKLADVNLTQTGRMMGTVSYMSPEQAQGTSIDYRTDIWSLGVVLYEMLTGGRPFQGEHEQVVLYAILQNEPASVSAVQASVPIAVARVVDRALAKERAARYQHIGDMLGDLEQVQGVSAPRRAPRWRRHYGYGALTGLVVLLMVGGLLRWTNEEAGSQGEPVMGVDPGERVLQRLAVLPFSNIQRDPETDYLGYAVADEIIGALAHVQDMVVRPSSSIRKYEGQVVDPARVGEELGVDYIVTGTFLRVVDEVHLNIECIDVGSNEILWRDALEVTFGNAFTLQERVADAVVKGLQIQFTEAERTRIQANVPQSPLAYEYYLRALAQPWTAQGNRLALDLLHQSLLLDSTYAPAFTERGVRTHVLGIMNYQDIEENIRKTEQAYQKALTLNPASLRALGSLSQLYLDLGRTEEAFDVVGQMREINPNNAGALYALADVHRYAGLLVEAKAAVEKAIALDPNEPSFYTGVLYYNLGEYDRSLEAFDRFGETPHALSWKGYVYLVQGKRDEALDHMERALAMEPQGMFASVSRIYKAFLEGDTLTALNAFRQREQLDPPRGEASYYDASDAVFIGYTEGALRALRKAVDLGYFNYPFMLRDPVLDPLRGEAEFEEILADAKAKHEAFKQRMVEDVR